MASRAPTVAPLTCRACGAAVPLPEADETSCDSCAAAVRLPLVYRALRDEAERARRARQEAEQKWREIPEPLPSWAAEASVWLVVVLAAALTTASVIAWAIFGLFESVRDMLVLGVFTPLFVLVWGMIESIAARSNARFVDTLAALPALADGRAPRCRVCGAPLRLEPHALAATCDYCRTDSLVTRVSASRRRELQRAKEELARQLGEAMSAFLTQRDDQGLLRIITLVVLAACWLGLWFGLPH